MTSSDIISITTVVISLGAFFIATLSYKRDRNKSNQDFLFQEKVLTYKELLFHVNYIFESFFDIMDEMLDHEGSNKKWGKFLNKESDFYDDLIADYYKSIFKALPIIPSNIYKELIQFGQESTQFINSAFDKDEDLTTKAHEELEKNLRNVISLIREDVNVDKLNVTLTKRLL
ncbi:hypothetical protein [Chryseobacterium indoltheticum]|uniref:Uncharacterized protein n=1 Tax=Chryseobacterium indoltheticum TaxID=254 RepID=A0A381FBW7_9FLAO|nr:hypothetical protein [Chryseobacterium indoltheticum]AZA73770.1 hypothetical protein EG358_08395 [Chryseobacterium indoltheticum]SIQ94609.1 hypothetical protein SAMN05421682_110114 [Chryseobacterium indoltheticum]SUX43963.1 Uncharacterised protein [Chryseobacterium indoltheticum]